MNIKKTLKSDSGYALGLVLIFVMAVGTVLGSVMMVTQLSSDAQGRGVDQLVSSNNVAVAVSDVIEQLAQDSAASYALQLTQNTSNCGLPEQLSDVEVSCQLVNSDSSVTTQPLRIKFTSKNGKTIERDFLVSADATTGTQSVQEVSR